MMQIEHLNKSFGTLDVLKDINLAINKGEVVSIIGPSGTGKSTLLRCINLLEQASSGQLTLDDQHYDFNKISKRERLAIRRNTAMVFQGFYLFNNKTVLENITEGLIIVKKLKKKAAIELGLNILEKVGLSDKAKAFPATLSGGQQQRVGIGRALALAPKILLFDEPTSALDPELVNEVLMLIQTLAHEQKTMLIVTHEIAFARDVSHRICFMDEGRIVEEGDACSVIDHPTHPRTQQFLSKFIN